MTRCTLLLALLGCLFVLGDASAHKPSYSNGEFSQKESAWFIEDVDVSIVLYHQVTCEAPEIWMAFETEEPGDIFVQLGVPSIDRLSDYRPSIALLAPGLPPATEALPFDVPSHLGVHVIDTEDLDVPADFFEPFTQTASWILFEDTVALPQAGRGYVVAFHPLRETGKLWVAVGETEEFGADDMANAVDWYESTQTFHETPDYPPEAEPVEQICPEPLVEAPPEVERLPETDPETELAEAFGDEPEAGTQEQDSVESGCAGSKTAPFALVWALTALLWINLRSPKEVARSA
jgi:hypothetical protein